MSSAVSFIGAHESADGKYMYVQSTCLIKSDLDDASSRPVVPTIAECHLLLLLLRLRLLFLFPRTPNTGLWLPTQTIILVILVIVL